ncbi:hypothetical protein ABIB35_001498 [Arthrobacter sp. UYP6]|uniref:phage major capsid protein n=1 Tax=Arthrobacter sp. UYP6 TaxID=1756378 RepID=UPI0033981450
MDLVNEGFRKAPTHQERVFEAAQLFAKGKSGASPLAQAVLLEAFSTSDFPVLLGAAFSKQAVQTQKDAVKEFEPLLVDITVDDFNRHKLVDLWSGDAFETVKQGEEYKQGDLSETELDHGAAKHGKSYGLTWELRRSRQFSALANFPKFLANGSIKGQNNAVADLLVKDNGWNAGLFKDVKTVKFSPDALDAAIKELAVRENHRGELVDVSDLVLVHGPALRTEVNRVLLAAEIELQVTDGNKVTKTRQTNPFRNVVTPLESRTIGQRLGAGQATAWALVQGKTSDLPSIIRTLLSGEENVDIRVKSDQGQRVGGGALSVEDGSFNDDTIWFRGRDVYGIDPGFTPGVWASAGA